MVESARFGPELRARRVAAGLSLGALATYLRYSKGYLSKIETGRMPARADLARRCDAYLKADGALAALVPGATAGTADGSRQSDRAGRRDRAGQSDLGQNWSAGFHGDGFWFAAMSRRDVLSAGAGALLAVGLDSGLAPRSAASRDYHAARGFEVLFGQMRALGRHTSPAVVLPTLVAQTNTLRGLAAQASSATRDRLLRLTSRYAEFTGWMAQEAGDEAAALWWTDVAAQLAGAAYDAELVAYTGIRRALVAMYRGDGAATVAAAGEAEHHRWPPTIREQAARRVAQGHAIQGDQTACLHALDRARELAPRLPSPASSTKQAAETPGPNADRAFVLGPTALSDPIAITAGWCLFDLGRWEEAVENLRPAVAALPPDATRSRARYGTRLALAQAALTDLPEATSRTADLLDAADAIDSATVRLDLRRLSRTLNRHSTDSAVMALSPRLTASL